MVGIKGIVCIKLSLSKRDAEAQLTVFPKKPEAL